MTVNLAESGDQIIHWPETLGHKRDDFPYKNLTNHDFQGLGEQGSVVMKFTQK